MKEKVTVTKCDFCSTEIEKSTPTITETVNRDGRTFGVEIRAFSPEARKRFEHDICRACLFNIVASVAPKVEPEDDANGAF